MFSLVVIRDRILVRQSKTGAAYHRKNGISKDIKTTCHLPLNNQERIQNFSSVKVRVLCQEGGCGGGQLISDWSKIQDGGWKAVFWLDNNSRWQLSLWLDKNSRWQMEKQSSDWTIIQDGGWNRTRLNKMKFSDWPKFKFKFSLM